MFVFRNFLVFALVMTISACVAPPIGIKPVSEFELKRYLGKWYEIARLDNQFEQGLSQVTAEYTFRNDAGIDVVNRGYNEETKRWEQAQGKAYFVENPNVGLLKVSFFGPFYSGYTVIELDKVNYQYALVSGSSRSYLWILARSPSLQPALLENLIATAKKNGFNTNDLVLVSHQQKER